MSISSEIERIKGLVQNCFGIAERNGASIPSTQAKTLNSLPQIIEQLVNTSDATATADDILSGKTAYVNGEKIVGSIPKVEAQLITPSTETQIVVDANTYVNGAIEVSGSSQLVPENIVYGTTIFGVSGKAPMRYVPINVTLSFDGGDVSDRPLSFHIQEMDVYTANLYDPTGLHFSFFADGVDDNDSKNFQMPPNGIISFLIDSYYRGARFTVSVVDTNIDGIYVELHNTVASDYKSIHNLGSATIKNLVLLQIDTSPTPPSDVAPYVFISISAEDSDNPIVGPKPA